MGALCAVLASTGATVATTGLAPVVAGATGASIGLVQTASVAHYQAPGTVITFSFQVTNPGPTSLTSVGVTDGLPGLSVITCPLHVLVAGGSETCSATYATTQADVDAGTLHSTAVATGTPPTGPAATTTKVLVITANQSVSIGVQKSADVSNFSAAGTVVNYSYAVTDTGNVTLHSASVTDPMPGLTGLSCPGTDLAPSATETCTATYTTTQADVDAGVITNTVNVTAAPHSGLVTSANATLTITSLQNPSIGLIKSADHTHFASPGTPISYSYAVSNTGNVTLNSVGVTDGMPGLSPVTCPVSALAPGAATTCTATYSTTQTDVDAGDATNTAIATGTPPTGSDVSSTDTLVIPSDQIPSVSVKKTADVSTFAAPGTPITYGYLVTNTGNVTLSSVGVTDPQPGLVPVPCPVATLAPLASETCTATYSTTQADVDAGGITNIGTVTATPPHGPAVTGTDQLIVPAVQSPSLSEVKSADHTHFATTGTLITYSYALANTGNVTLTSVGVTDAQPGLALVSCPTATLAPGATETCTATHTTTQADLDTGGITNIGNATSTAPAGQTVVDSSTLTVIGDQNPAVSVAKSASTASVTAAGTPVTYSYLVTNTGNLTLSSVAVTDPQPGLSLAACPSATLAPGSSETCAATYTTTQHDIDAGSITNTGTATALSQGGQGASGSSTLVIPAVQSPAIGLVKSASISTFGAAGVPVTYSYLVTDSGNVTLTSVGVNDPMGGLSTIICPFTTLAPSASEICAATYATTQGDLDVGAVTNTGTATGTPPVGGPVTHADSLIIPATLSPSVGLQKSASVTSYSSAGTPVTYSYLVTDSGNNTLTHITVTDPQYNLSAVICPFATLAPGHSETCTANYTTTQADVDTGFIINAATVKAKPATGSALQLTRSLTVPAVQRPGVSVVKSASITGFSAPGTPVTYSYLVTDSGNVTLTAVHVTDPQPGLSVVNCPQATLAPGTSETCTATYATSQPDVDAGGITNVGTATGTPPFASPVSSTASLTVPAAQNPAVAVAKSASIAGFAAAGVPVTYSYLVTNIGNVTLTSVGVTDPMTGLLVVNCPQTTLAPGTSETCTATYSTSQADVDAGRITNVGTATGTPPSGDPVSGTAMVTVPAAQSPGIGVTKTASIASFSGPGTHVTYTYLVTDTGNVTLHAVGVTDPMPSLSAVTCPDTTLAPGDTVTCTATYTTTQADVDHGSITNTGTAAGTPPTGPAVTATASASVPSTTSPSIIVSKSASVTGYSAPGAPITYSYLVTNTGNKTLSSVHVNDPQLGLALAPCPSATLAPHASEVCTGTYSTTQSDLDAGSITNNGTAMGTPPTGPPVTGTDSLTIRGTQSPVVTVAKSANVLGYSAPGIAITYHYLVTNTGNVTLTTVHVNDPMTNLSPVICPAGTLAPGASETCAASYTTTQADVDAGGVTNTGTATGTPPSGSDVRAHGTLTIHATQSPAITVAKTANVASFSGVGTPVAYSYQVTNTGNVTLATVAVSDPQPGLSLVTCPSSPLAPGAHVICVATYATTLADVTGGHAANTGTASGTPPTGPAVHASATLTIPFTPPACYVGPWPSRVTGFPVLPDHGAAPTGVFIGQVHNVWEIYTHNQSGGTTYTGTITSTGSLLHTQLLQAEHDDKFTQPNIQTITFKFITATDLDGIEFTTSCGASVSITVSASGPHGLLPSRVFEGNPTTSGYPMPQVFARSY